MPKFCKKNKTLQVEIEPTIQLNFKKDYLYNGYHLWKF